MLTFLRVVVSFAIVGAVLYAFVKASSGRLGSMLGGARGGQRAALEVVERRQLTRTSTIALLRAGDRHLLVGVGDGGVTLLAEGDDLTPPVENNEEQEAPEPLRGGRLRLPSLGRGAAANELQMTDSEPAWTRLDGAEAPRPTWMNLLAALRELTVRRS